VDFLTFQLYVDTLAMIIPLAVFFGLGENIPQIACEGYAILSIDIFKYYVDIMALSVIGKQNSITGNQIWFTSNQGML